MREFVAEQYVAKSDVDVPTRGAEAARVAAEALSAEGRRVEFVRFIFVPEDETCIYIFGADSIEDVRAALARTGLRFEGVAEAVTHSNDRGTR